MQCLQYLKLLVLTVLLTGLSLQAHAATDLSEYTHAMQRLEADFNRKSGTVFSDIVDFDTILDRTFDRLEKDVDPKFRQGFTQGFKKKGTLNLIQRIVGTLPDKNGVKLIRVIQRDNKVYAAMRFNFQEQGYGYSDYELTKDRNGKVRIVDWYDYQSGQDYSRTLMQIVATVSPNPNLIGRIFELATGQKSFAKDVMAMIQAAGKQDYDTIRSTYKSFDDSMKKNWIIMVLSYNLANMSGDMDFYGEVLVDMEKHFANDPRASFVLIDYYFLNEKYSEALACINKLARVFDYKDAGLWHLNANTHIMQGNYPKAVEAALEGIRHEPDFEESYWALLTAQVMSNDNASATDTLIQLEQRFDYLLSREALSKDETFKDYINSPEYLRLERSR